MTTIDDKNTICTFINVFTVDPSKQQELLDVLKEATEQVICKQQGYISANIHVSDDKKTVVNYAQWKTIEDLDKMQQNPECQEHMQKASAIAPDFKPVTYNFIYTHSLMDVLMAEAQAEAQENKPPEAAPASEEAPKEEEEDGEGEEDGEETEASKKQAESAR